METQFKLVRVIDDVEHFWKNRKGLIDGWFGLYWDGEWIDNEAEATTFPRVILTHDPLPPHTTGVLEKSELGEIINFYYIPYPPRVSP